MVIKLINSEKGFTLLELLISIAIGAMLISVLVLSIFQTIRVTTQSSTSITALRDITYVAQSVFSDVRMAQTTDPDVGEPVADYLTIDWTTWDDSTGDLISTDHHCEYTLISASGTVQRKYWEDYDPGSPGSATSTSTFGYYISDIEFSSHTIAGGNSYVKVVIVSSPDGQPETEVDLTYHINMRTMSEVLVP